jgi:hypothetical protein
MKPKSFIRTITAVLSETILGNQVRWTFFGRSSRRGCLPEFTLHYPS